MIDITFDFRSNSRGGGSGFRESLSSWKRIILYSASLIFFLGFVFFKIFSKLNRDNFILFL